MKKSFILVFLFLLLAVVILLITGCPFVKNKLPTATKVSGPEGNIDQNNSTFSWSGNDSDGSIAKYEYRKDGGAWTNHALNTSYNWNDYAEGPHTFEVRTQDNEGAYSNIIIWNFTYDKANQPPVVAKVSGPEGNIDQNNSTFSWSGNDPDGSIAKYEYRKDGGAWTNHALNTSYNWNDYAEGPHTFEVRTQDNEGAYSNIISWSFKYVVVGEMVLVERGTFMMGDEFGDLGDGCGPVHEVILTYEFWLGKYEVTFDEYDTFRRKPEDEGWGRESRPVINVSWWDAIAYCNWLSQKEGLPVAYRLRGEVNEGQLLDSSGNLTTDITKVVGYRLPTEAEWEYAARGGNKSKGYKYAGSDNVDDVAWYDSNSGGKTQEVGKKAPNELGIYDMSGNVLEWCSDWIGRYSSSAQTNPYNDSGSYRVNRGGSWDLIAMYSRVAVRRVSYSPAGTTPNLGFRIARTVP